MGRRRQREAVSGPGSITLLLLALQLALSMAASEPASTVPAASAAPAAPAAGAGGSTTNPMGLTGGDVLGNVAQHYASSRGRGTNGKGFLSFLGWGKRRRGEGGTPPGPTRKRTPFFIPPEMMRLEEQGEGEEGGAAVGGDNVVDGPEVAYSWQQESEVEARALTDEEESEAEEVAAVLVSRMTRSSRTATTTTADGNGGLEVEEETVVEEEEEELFIVTDSETAEQLLAVADAAAAAAEADKDDGIPNGRSLLASLSVIGGGLPLKRGGSDALCIKATNPAVGAAAVSKGPQQPQQQPQQPAAAVVTTTTAAATDDGDMDVDVDVDEDVDEVATATELEEEEEEHDEALPSGGVAHVRTTTTTTRATTVARHVHTHTHRHVHTERRHTALLAGPGAAAHQGLSDAALGARFRAATARRIAALAPEQRAALEELRAYLYGAEVAPERVRAADQLVVCGDRGAMMLAFLARKNFNVETAKRSFDRVIAWRIEEKIETVIEDGRLPRAKVEKHRECWPTAFYEQDCEGDPIFVDRMGILDLGRLKKEPLALDMKDMVTYYVQTMESRRRLLFPQLSRATGRLVTQCVVVIDVANFGPMHFGGHALGFMKEMGNVHDENWSDLTKSLFIINAPGGWLFRSIFKIIQGMMSQEVKERLKILNKKDSVKELAKITDPATAQRIVEGDHDLERAVERELHAFMDAAAREGEHRRSWGAEERKGEEEMVVAEAAGA